jgi:pimeloyl-ACP methyl ester carboxylesterase
MSTSAQAALLAAATMMLAQATSLANMRPVNFDPGPYMHPQRLIDIGRRRLNLYCSGSGSPTVLLDASGGSDMLDWRFIQPVVAKLTRVCSYDRAGYGFSDPGPLPRDASASVTDLHQLVERAGIARPFVLVGYSTGTLHARLYGDRYLHDLAGMVLVEPDLEDHEKGLFAAAPALAPFFAQGAAAKKACAAAAERGGLQPHTKMYDLCVGPPDPELPTALNAVQTRQSLRLQSLKDSLSEDTTDSTTSTTQVRLGQRHYGDLPLAVVTAADVFPPGAYLPPAERRAERNFLRKLRAPLARYSSKGSRLEIDGCSHGDIATHCASSVASAIDTIVDEARRMPHARP